MAVEAGDLTVFFFFFFFYDGREIKLDRFFFWFMWTMSHDGI